MALDTAIFLAASLACRTRHKLFHTFFHHATALLYNQIAVAMRQVLGTIYILCFGGLWGFGQNAPMHLLDTVEISQSRDLWAHPGGRTVRPDSATLARWAGLGLHDWLGQRADVFIKSYGSGSLATSSIRGGGASHTALIWNGISLQSPMNGQQDLSLLPMLLMDQLRVQFGSASAQYGSGAVGGSIHIDHKSAFGQGTGIRALAQTGSFGQQMQGLDISFSQPKWLSRTRIFRQLARHDFPVQEREGARQPHAHTHSQGILQELGWKAGARQTLRAWLWLQTQDRQLPPTLSQLQSVARQDDAAQRAAVSWQHLGNTYSIHARAALLHEQLQFRDSLADIDADNRSRSYVQEIEIRHQLGRGHAWQGGLTHTWQKAQADGFGSLQPQQQQAALWVSYRYTAPRLPWTYALSLRQGWSPAQEIPLTPDVSLKGKLSKGLYLRAQAGRSFRLPTFNDRYWQPGGNLNLQPEQGWHQEIGLDYKPKHWELQLTGFHQLIDDWILWRPGPTYWFPENLRKVRSLGIESSAQARYKLGKWQHSLSLAHTWTQSRNVAVTQARDASLGKQLIYTPTQQGRIGLTSSRRAWEIALGHTWTGRRYTTSDNTFFLPGYQAAQLSVQYRLQRPRWQTTVGGRIDNLWNADFQLIENRPMPPRSFRLTITFHFHQPILQAVS